MTQAAGGRAKDMRLKIVACRHIYTGRNPTGQGFTIYEVDAAREDGQLIREKLRSFVALPIGEVVEVSVTPFNSERHGRSFTLHPKQSTSPSGTEQVNALLARLDQLEQRVKHLEGKLEQASVGQASASAAAPIPAEAAKSW